MYLRFDDPSIHSFLLKSNTVSHDFSLSRVSALVSYPNKRWNDDSCELENVKIRWDHRAPADGSQSREGVLLGAD